MRLFARRDDPQVLTLKHHIDPRTPEQVLLETTDYERRYALGITARLKRSRLIAAELAKLAQLREERAQQPRMAAA